MRRNFWPVIGILTFVIALWGSGNATRQSAAAFTPSPFQSAAGDTTEVSQYDLKLFPIIFTSPDTRLAFGVLPQLVFTAPNSTRQSRAFIAAYYTLNRQYAVSLVSSLWLNGDRDFVEVMAETKNWPTDFYGLGSRTVIEQSEDMTQRLTWASVSVSRLYGGLLRLGVLASVANMGIRDTDPAGNLGTGLVPGWAGGWTVGLGPVIGIDTRDHVFYPSSGVLLKLGFVKYGGILGGDYSFSELKFDGRTFFRLTENQILGFQGVFNLQTEGGPFWKMMGMGRVLRGFESIRFLDRNMSVLQMEYRVVPVVWKLGFSIFAGVGSVSPSVGKFSDSRFHPAAGFGIRYRYMEDALIHLRWDFGFAKGSSGDYLEMGEAF